jgi:hypothetical protein
MYKPLGSGSRDFFWLESCLCSGHFLFRPGLSSTGEFCWWSQLLASSFSWWCLQNDKTTDCSSFSHAPLKYWPQEMQGLGWVCDPTLIVMLKSFTTANAMPHQHKEKSGSTSNGDCPYSKACVCVKRTRVNINCLLFSVVHTTLNPLYGLSDSIFSASYIISRELSP